MSIESVKGKWALITGASRGIGRQISLSLAGLGCNLILHSRTDNHTDDLLQETTGLGVKAVQVSGELSDQSQVDSLIDQALQKAEEIDFLFNNAAVMTAYRQNHWETPADDFRTSFEINVISLIRICNRLTPLMLKRKNGRIINFTSGIKDQPQLTAYAVSKAAVEKFVKDSVPSLEGTGVMMNLLDPGWLRTDLGGDQAPNPVESVIPGALVPALLDDGISGRIFRAQDYSGLTLADALKKGLEVKI